MPLGKIIGAFGRKRILKNAKRPPHDKLWKVKTLSFMRNGRSVQRDADSKCKSWRIRPVSRCRLRDPAPLRRDPNLNDAYCSGDELKTIDNRTS
jgi:hypothetical protein